MATEGGPFDMADLTGMHQGNENGKVMATIFDLVTIWSGVWICWNLCGVKRWAALGIFRRQETVDLSFRFKSQIPYNYI